jgi:IS605 OrfB family transposase
MMKGREKFPLAIGNYQRHLLTSQNPKSATLVKKRSGDYYLQIQIHSEPPQVKETDKYLGVDLGRRDIAVTSEGHSFSGEQTSKIRDRFSQVRASVQKKASKGTRSSRRRCRQFLARLSGRERRFQAWQNHTISYRLVQYAKTNNQFISLEDLTGIRERTNKKPRSKTERRRSNSWAFYQLRQFLKYKCIKEGVGLVLVNPAYSSQTCHKCLHIHPEKGKSYRNEKKFSCGNCGWKGDADLNGAKNIEQLGRSVNTPGGSSYLRCDLSYDSSGLLKAANSAAGGWQ